MKRRRRIGLIERLFPSDNIMNVAARTTESSRQLIGHGLFRGHELLLRRLELSIARSGLDALPWRVDPPVVRITQRIDGLIERIQMPDGGIERRNILRGFARDKIRPRLRSRVVVHGIERGVILRYETKNILPIRTLQRKACRKRTATFVKRFDLRREVRVERRQHFGLHIIRSVAADWS